MKKTIMCLILTCNIFFLANIVRGGSLEFCDTTPFGMTAYREYGITLTGKTEGISGWKAFAGPGILKASVLLHEWDSSCIRISKVNEVDYPECEPTVWVDSFEVDVAKDEVVQIAYDSTACDFNAHDSYTVTILYTEAVTPPLEVKPTSLTLEYVAFTEEEPHYGGAIDYQNGGTYAWGTKAYIKVSGGEPPYSFTQVGDGAVSPNNLFDFYEEGFKIEAVGIGGLTVSVSDSADPVNSVDIAITVINSHFSRIIDVSDGLFYVPYLQYDGDTYNALFTAKRGKIAMDVILFLEGTRKTNEYIGEYGDFIASVSTEVENLWELKIPHIFFYESIYKITGKLIETKPVPKWEATWTSEGEW